MEQTTVITEAMIEKVRSFLGKNHRTSFQVICFTAISVIAGIVLFVFFFTKNDYKYLAGAILCVVIGLGNILIDMYNKKKSTPMMKKGTTIKYEFDDVGILVNVDGLSSYINYPQISQAILTPAVYILISKNKKDYLVIDPEGFSEEDRKSFPKFIMSKGIKSS